MTAPRVRLGGLLGRALDANHHGRLSRFITDEASPAIALFHPQRADQNREGDWYGEHAGKWLQAAARCAARTQDAQLAARVRRVADYLVSVQRPDGYLGTYAPERRFTVKPLPPQRTWDGAPGLRTWDIWIHSHLILGLVEVHRLFSEAAHLEAARRIAGLCHKALIEDGIDVTHLGNHFGLSATVLLDALVELHGLTGDPRDLDLARAVLAEADARPELRLLSMAFAGADAAEIGTGKVYQICWNLVGLVKLHRATGEARLLEAVMKVWTSIRDRHLTLGGGPWGGVAHRSREVFNAPGAFSPHGYVETCSTFAWIQLNRVLLAVTGEARFAEELERSAYNDLLGAQAPGGEDWCYYSFPNGKRVFTTYWRCCKSSGAVALEELAQAAYSAAGDEVSINLYGPGAAELDVAGAGPLALTQETQYPFAGAVCVRLTPSRRATFTVRLRIPAWVEDSRVAMAPPRVNGSAVEGRIKPGGWLVLRREWQAGDEIRLDFPMTPVARRQSNRNVQESFDPDGAPVRQEVLRFDYLAVTRGPLVYATGLVDGFRVEETLRAGDVLLEDVGVVEGFEGPAVRLSAPERAPLLFVPYYEAGGRRDGAWRLTWLSLSPLAASPSPRRPRTPRGKP